MANQLIQKLLDAEQEADVIIRRAKENWTKKIKEAQVSAEEDIKRFREHEEAKFQREYQEKLRQDDQTTDLEEQTRNDIELVKHQFRKHRDAAVALLISGVVRVDTTLSEREQRQVQQFFSSA